MGIAAIFGFGCSKSIDFATSASLERVDAFQRTAQFIAKDSELKLLDVTLLGEPRPVFKISQNELNSQIAPAQGGDSAYFSDGRTIFRISKMGRVESVATLEDLSSLDHQLDDYVINWFVGVNPTESVLYFVLLLRHDGKRTKKTDYVCSLDLATKQIQVLEFYFPSGIDVDLDAGIVYSPHIPAKLGIVVKSFDGEIDRCLPTVKSYSRCKLAAERNKLLLSTTDLDENPSIAILDLETGQETILPFSGSCATWGPRNTIFFVQGENSLWRYVVGDDKPERLFLVRDARNRQRGSFASMPVVSADNSWLAWGWAAKGKTDPALGTVLIDLTSGEYRTLDGWWHNVQWLTK